MLVTASNKCCSCHNQLLVALHAAIHSKSWSLSSQCGVELDTLWQDVACEWGGNLTVQHNSYLGGPFAALQHDTLLLCAWTCLWSICSCFTCMHTNADMSSGASDRWVCERGGQLANSPTLTVHLLCCSMALAALCLPLPVGHLLLLDLCDNKDTISKTTLDAVYWKRRWAKSKG